jgi:hypothetical protein
MLSELSTNLASTSDWLLVSKDLSISLYEVGVGLGGDESKAQTASSGLAGSASVRLSLLPFEQDWNAPGMDLYDAL